MVINGIVRDRSGRPVAQARVYFLSGPVPLPDIALLTGADGTFRLAAPVAGSYSLGCTTPDGESVSRAVEVTGEADASVSFEIPY